MLLRLLALGATLLVPGVSLAQVGAAPGSTAQSTATLDAIEKRLDGVAGVSRDEHGVWLASPNGTRFRVVSAPERKTPKVATSAGPVGVGWLVLQLGPRTALDALEALAATAKTAGIATGGLTLAADALLGPHLTGTERLVFGRYVLARVATTGPSRVDSRRALATIGAAIDRLPLTALAKKSLRATLANVFAEEKDEDLLDPAIAVRLITSGWLKDILPPSDERDDFERRIAGAAELVPVRRFSGGGVHVTSYRNGFGSGGQVLRSAERCAYEVAVGERSPLPSMVAVVELPPGSDPIADAAEATAITMYAWPRTPLARWTEAGGLTVEPAWKERVQSERRIRALVTGYLPPHVVLAGLDGAIHRLITRHGAVEPPAGGSAEAVARFVAAAADALPDAAHLDLLRNHMFSYVHDSPDVRIPALCGTPTEVADIHQTPEQTLGTTAGGVFRGDCDDLAEVFQRIAAAQGRLGHIMGLPGHNAFGFVEKRGGVYTTSVLQTGPPLEFRHRRVTRSLERAYQWFAPNVPFDPDEVPIAVRFSGENKRSEWVLSHRIYTDPDYARTMIDVQRDWHFHTYQRGTTKMLRLIAAGDEDAANYRELAGLSEQTGRYRQAAAYLDHAMQRGTDRVLGLAIRRIANLYEAGQREQARAAVDALLGDRLRAVRRRQGDAYWQIVTGLVAAVVSTGKDHATGLRVLGDTIGPLMSRQVDLVGRWLKSSSFDADLWHRSEPYDTIRRLLRSYIATCIELVRGLRDDPERAAAVRRLRADVEKWIRYVSGRDVDEPSDHPERVAMIGAYRHALDPDALRAGLEKAGFPRRVPSGRTPRGDLDAERRRDLRAINASVPFWFQLLVERLDDDARTLDVAEVERLVGRVEAAHAATGRLGLQSTWFDYSVRQARLIRALVREDRGEIARSFRLVRDQDDKWLRDMSARWIGTAARFLRPAFFRDVLDAWAGEVDFKPSWFNIAWTAALHGAPRRAIEAARTAVERHGDDPAFVGELAEMERRFGG